MKRFNIPMADGTPDPFPQPTIQASRALCAIKQKFPDKLMAAFTEIYNGIWLDLKPIGKPEVYSEYLARVFSQAEVEQIVEASATPAVKEQLVKNTDYAVEEGCFGLPYYIATNAQGESDTFWGFDHLAQVIDHLGLQRSGPGFSAML